MGDYTAETLSLLGREFEASEVRGILGSNARDVLAEIWAETALTDGPC